MKQLELQLKGTKDKRLVELRQRINKKFGLQSLAYMTFFDTYIRNKKGYKVWVKVVCDDCFYILIGENPPVKLYDWAYDSEEYNTKVEAKVKARLFDKLKNL